MIPFLIYSVFLCEVLYDSIKCAQIRLKWFGEFVIEMKSRAYFPPGERKKNLGK